MGGLSLSRRWYQGLSAGLPAQRSEQARLQDALQQSLRLPLAEAPTQPLLAGLARLIDLLREGDDRFGVRLAQIALPGRSGPGSDGLPDAQGLLQLARPVQGIPGVQGLRLEVRLRYRSYPGLKAWFAQLRQVSLCIEQLTLEEGQVQWTGSLFGR